MAAEPVPAPPLPAPVPARAPAAAREEPGPAAANGLVPVLFESQLSFAAGTRAQASVEVPRTAMAALLDRRGGEAAPVQAADVTVSQFAGMQRFAGSGSEELQRALRTPAFVEAMDQMREEVRKEFNLEKTAAISVAGISLGMSVVYVLWLIRGGVLMGSYLSALPAWRILDPLPVLSRVDDEVPDEDDELDAMAKRSDPLRGF